MLTATTGSWTGSPTSYTYQWQDCGTLTCSNIQNASGSSYQLQHSDVGDTIDVVVTASNDGGSGKATSKKTSTATAAPSPPAAPTNVQVTDITIGSMDLTWNAVSGATSYNVHLYGYDANTAGT